MRGSCYVFNIKRIASGSSRLLMAVFGGMPNTYSSDFLTEVSPYTARLYNGNSMQQSAPSDVCFTLLVKEFPTLYGN